MPAEPEKRRAHQSRHEHGIRQGQRQVLWIEHVAVEQVQRIADDLVRDPGDAPDREKRVAKIGHRIQPDDLRPRDDCDERRECRHRRSRPQRSFATPAHPAARRAVPLLSPPGRRIPAQSARGPSARGTNQYRTARTVAARTKIAAADGIDKTKSEQTCPAASDRIHSTNTPRPGSPPPARRPRWAATAPKRRQRHADQPARTSAPGARRTRPPTEPPSTTTEYGDSQATAGTRRPKTKKPTTAPWSNRTSRGSANAGRSQQRREEASTGTRSSRPPAFEKRGSAPAPRRSVSSPDDEPWWVANSRYSSDHWLAELRTSPRAGRSSSSRVRTRNRPVRRPQAATDDSHTVVPSIWMTKRSAAAASFRMRAMTRKRCLKVPQDLRCRRDPDVAVLSPRRAFERSSPGSRCSRRRRGWRKRAAHAPASTAARTRRETDFTQENAISSRQSRPRSSRPAIASPRRYFSRVGYFTCSDSTYFRRFAIRSVSFPSLRKTGPQTGIAELP